MYLLSRKLAASVLLAALSAFVVTSPTRGSPFVTWQHDSSSGFDMQFGGMLAATNNLWTTGPMEFTSPTGLWEFSSPGIFVHDMLGNRFAHVSHLTGRFLGDDPFSFSSYGGYATSVYDGSSSGNSLSRFGSHASYVGMSTTLFEDGDPDDLSTWTYSVHVAFGSYPSSPSSAVPEPSTYGFFAAGVLITIILRRRRSLP